MKRIKEEDFDVVLLDVKMPGGMDGIETLREIKKMRPSTEVVLLTGHASIETNIEGKKFGAFDFLLKPIKLDDLIVKLSEAFKNKEAGGFTAKYQISRLVYFELFDSMYDAISREKQIKAGPRKKKLDLIRAQNPSWRDLYQDIRE